MKRIALMLSLASLAVVLVAVPAPAPANTCGLLHPEGCAGAGLKQLELPAVQGYRVNLLSPTIYALTWRACMALTGDANCKTTEAPQGNPLAFAEIREILTRAFESTTTTQNHQFECEGVNANGCRVRCGGDYQFGVGLTNADEDYSGVWFGRTRAECSMPIQRITGGVQAYKTGSFQGEIEAYHTVAFDRPEKRTCQGGTQCKGSWEGYGDWSFNLGEEGYWYNWPDPPCRTVTYYILFCSLGPIRINIATDNN